MKALSVGVLEPADMPAWQAFIARSPNATLFHDLDFLAYHGSSIDFHHLVVRGDGNLVAAVPGGLVEAPGGKTTWRSPVGASIGGPAFALRASTGKPALAHGPRLDHVMAVVDALQAHGRAQGWSSIDMTLPPSVFHPEAGDVVAFALVRHGFREQGRWLSPMIDLDRVAADASPEAALFEKRQLQAMHGAQAAGVSTSLGGFTELKEFAPVFEETYARLATRPTHTIADLEFLMRRFPDRVYLELARQGSRTIAGILVTRLTSRVAVTTYICSTDEGRRAGGVVLAVSALLNRLRRDAVRWLDLGPSATERSTNAGVMLFKEGLGGVGYSRVRWACPL